jgi:hypothetical protein
MKKSSVFFLYFITLIIFENIEKVLNFESNSGVSESLNQEIDNMNKVDGVKFEDVKNASHSEKLSHVPENKEDDEKNINIIETGIYRNF